MFDIVGRYKLLIEILLIGSIVTGAIFGIHSFLMHEQQIGYDRAAGEYKDKLIEAQKQAEIQTKEFNRRIQEANDAATKREKVLQASADATAAANRGLLNTIGNFRDSVSGASTDALSRSVNTLLSVFGECTTRYTEVARSLDRANSDKQTLIQAWPK